MFKPKKGMTVEQVLRELEKDPEFARRKAERDQELAAREAQSKKDQRELLKDLESVGVRTDSVWSLVNTSSSYARAIPILLEHLRRPYPDGIREGIARALAVRATRSLGWQTLVEEFCKTDVSNMRVKDGLAVALAGASDDSVLSELIGLARDRRHGSSRVLLLLGIKRSRRPEAKESIAELASDPELSKEIGSWKRRRK